ncbi:hypothetical protein M2145_002537 [Lachnospiraceae bacterium PF1-21]
MQKDIETIEKLLNEIKAKMSSMEGYIREKGLYKDYMLYLDQAYNDYQNELDARQIEIKFEKNIPESVISVDYKSYEVEPAEAEMYINSFTSESISVAPSEFSTRFYYRKLGEDANENFKYIGFDIRTGETEVFESPEEVISWCKNAKHETIFLSTPQKKIEKVR